MNWHLTGDEAAYIIDNCGAKAFIADARFAPAAAGAAAQSPDATARLAIGDIDGFEPYEDALAPEAGDDIDDPSLGTTMLYTSGTTGRPKGVLRKGTAPTATSVATAFTYDPATDVALCTGPLYHAAPLAFSLSVPLINGLGIVLMDGWDAEDTLRLIDQHRVTHSHMVPTMFHRLVTLPDDVRAKYDVSSLKAILHGAAPCPVAVKQALMDWLGPIVWEYYAATEGWGSFVTPEEWLAKPGTVGKPSFEDGVRILDDDGNPVAVGEVGTLYLKAPDVATVRVLRRRRQDAGRVPRERLLHARRHGLLRRRRVPVPHRSQRQLDHLGRRQHLPGRGRRGVAQSPRGGRRRHHRHSRTTSGARK